LANTENDGGGQSSSGILDEVLDQMSGQMSIALAQVATAVEKLQVSLDRADESRSKTDEKMDKLLQTLQTLADAPQENSDTEILQSSQEYSALTELISGQEKLLERLLIESDNSEIKMNLKNIDTHFSKALEEIPSNYRETTIVLREGLDRLIETIEKLDKSTEKKDPFDTERKN
jgi:Mg2+ and Co2+ transporter CorA